MTPNSDDETFVPTLSSLDNYLAKERSDRRVLSIQSHVVSGFVGNKCAVFPLQLHGFEVDSVNSVQFSNHTQYVNGARGQRLNQQDLELLVEGLRVNRLDRNYSHVLTGYCGDASFLRALASIVRDCRQHRPQLLYFCDPVLGDNGRYYVAEELRDIYRQELLPLADVITPNAFELSELTGGQPVHTEVQCLRAIAQLHAEAPNLRSVVCTSGLLQTTTAAEEQQKGMHQPKTMHCYASERRRRQVDPAQSGKTPAGTSFRLFRFTIPIIGATFVGTGDLFSALLLLWLDETGGQLCASLRATIASMQAVLRRTAAAAAQQPDSSEPNLASPELRLVQSRLDLLQPKADEIEFTELDASGYFE